MPAESSEPAKKEQEDVPTQPEPTAYTVQEPPCSVPVPLPTVDKTEKFCYVSIEELAAMVEKG